jgi:hypothetical protein
LIIRLSRADATGIDGFLKQNPSPKSEEEKEQEEDHEED